MRDNHGGLRQLGGHRLMRLAALALIAALAGLAAFVSTARAASCTWTGLGADENWSTILNWDGCVPDTATETAVFDGTANGFTDKSVTINSSINIEGISMGANYSGTITQGSSTITLASAGFVQAGGTFAGGSGNITVNGPFTLSGGTSFTSTSGTLVVTGNWAHSGSVTFAHNSGTVFLGGGTTTMDFPGSSGTETFNHLELNTAPDNSTRTVANGDQVIVNGTLTLTDAFIGQAASAPATGTVVANGNITQTTGTDGASGVATLFISGAGAQALTGSANASTGLLPPVTINKTTGSLTLAGTIRTNANWTNNTGGTATFSAGTSSIHFAAGTITGAQTFNNLTFSSSTPKTVASAITIDGTLDFNGTGNIAGAGSLEAKGNIQQSLATSLSVGSATANSAALNIVGTGSQTLTGVASPTTARLPAVNINKPNGTLTLASGIRTDRNWTYTAGTLDPGTSTLHFAPSTSLTVSGSQTLNNVTLSGVGTVSMSGGTTLTVPGTTALTDGLLNGAGTLTAQGPITQASAFDGGTGTLTINGSAAQTFTGSAASGAGLLPNVVVNKSSNTLTLAGTLRSSNAWTYSGGTVDEGASTFITAAGASFAGTQTLQNLEVRGATTIASGTLSVDGQLTFFDANVSTTGGAVLALTAAAPDPVRTTTGHVVGNLLKNVATGASVSRTFEVGTATDYLPVTLAFTNATSGNVTARANAGHQGDLANSGISTTKHVHDYWTLTNSGTGLDSYAATFTFVSVENAANTAAFRVARHNGTAWALQAAGTRTGTTTEATGITGATMGDFVVGELGDVTAPTDTFSLRKGDGSGAIAVADGAFYPGTGTAIFYRGSKTGGGSFKIRDTVTDADSGPASATFGALGGTAGGWTFTGDTETTPGAGVYDSNTYTWPESETAAPTTAVFSTDVANNNSTATTFTLTNDVTSPSGGSVTFTGLGGAGTVYRTSLDIPVVLANGSDAGAGVSTTTEVLDRLEATLSSPGTANGTCGAFGADGSFTPLTNPSLSFTDAVSIESGKCYRYTYTVLDNVGNSVTYTSADVKVDASAPATPLTVAEVASDPDSHVSGTTLFYRPGGGRSGSFTVDAAATDDQSGIEKVNFPVVGSGVTRTAPGGGDDTAPTPYQGAYDWADTASASGAQTVTATNNAGGTDTADFTLTVDSAAPSGGSVTFTGLVGTGSVYRNVASIPVVLANGADGAGSGVNATTESLQRLVADLTSTGILDGSCGAFANDGAATVNPDLSFTDSTGIVTGKCYRYQYTVADNVGNEVVYTSADVKVDTTAPAAPAQAVTENPSDPDQHASGSTLFYRPGTDGGTFRVTSTATDAQSGIKHLSFPSLANVTGGGANDTTSPYEADYTWSVSTLAGDAGDKNVTATNNADGTGAAGTFALTADSTGPTDVGISFTGLTGTGAVYRSSADIPVVLDNGTDGSGSGINGSTESLQRFEAPLTSSGGTANGVCGTFVADGSAIVNPSLSFTDTASIESKCYRYEYTVTDNVGNATTVTSADVKVDASVPATPVLTASDGGDPDSHVSGSTIFLRTDATPAASDGGSFTIDAATTDSESGIEKVAFPSLSGSSISGGGDDATPTPYRGSYTWTTSSTAVASATVTATNNATGTASAGFSVAIDNTNPTGSVSYFDGLSSIGTASVGWTASDGGSGLASWKLYRDSAAINPDTTCAAFPGTYATLVADAPGVTPVSDTLPGEGCYRYRLELSDNVGNTAIVAPAFTYRFGTGGPLAVAEGTNPAKQHKVGATLYVGTDGTFKITVPTSALPAGSTVDFPAVAATGLTGTANSGDTAPFESNVYTFASEFSGSTPLVVTLNAAGDGSSTETLTVTRDTSLPSTSDNTVALGGAWFTSSPTVLLSPSDSGSGVRDTYHTIDGSTPTTGSATGTGFALPEGQHTVKYFSVDNVDNAESVQTAGTTIRVDLTNPANAITRASVSGASFLTGSTLYYRGVAAGSFTLSNAVSDATSGPASSTYPAVTATGWTHADDGAVTTPAGGPYASSTFSWTAGTTSSPTHTITAADAAGRTASTTLTFVNDSTAPAGGAIVANGSGSDSYNNTGTVAISLTSFTDAGSGVASTSITRASAPLTGVSCGTFSGADPVTLSGGNDTFTAANGTCYRYTFTATDNLGQTSTAATSASVKVDTTAPTATIDSGPVGTVTSSSATFMFSSDDANANFQCRRDGGAFEACSSSATFSGFTAGTHTVDVRAVDPAGNVGPVDSHSWTVASTGPNVAPTLASSTPDDGTTVASISSISLTASETVTWSSITVQRDSNPATSHTCSGSQTATMCSFNYASTTAGAYTLQATISDGVATVTIETHFTIWSGSAGSDAPAVQFNAGGSTGADATASNGVASVTVPAGATTDSIVVRVDPKPTTTAATGFAVGADTVEVTASRTSDDQPVTRFSSPLDIHFPNALADAVPLRSQDGVTFTPFTLMFSHELPPTWDDGFYRDQSGTVHILTRHLTFFTLYRDLADPTAPRSLVGVVAGDGLTLRWEPAADNAGVAGYVLLVDGTVVQAFGGQTYEAKLGAFTAGDLRTFTIKARDAVGRFGPTSNAVRGVPSLLGLTLEQATAALAARGFTLGAVSGTTGTVVGQSPAAPGAAPVGSAVDVTVGSSTSGQAKLVLRVASAKRISLASRRWIAVRVTVSTPSQVTGELVDPSDRVVKRYAAKTVPSGSSTIRFALPMVRKAGSYKLQVRATASGQRVARTARVQLVPGVPKARFTPIRRPIGVVVVDGSIKGLNLGSSFRVNYVVPSLAFDVVGLQPAFVEAAVIDLDAVDKGFVRSLRQVFPELKILVLAPTSAAAAQARADGASIALVKPVPASRVAALLHRALGR